MVDVKVGSRVVHVDGSIQGVITRIVLGDGNACFYVMWDDGKDNDFYSGLDVRPI